MLRRWFLHFIALACIAYGLIWQIRVNLFGLATLTNPLQGPQDPARFSIMSYNVENLFDARHDPGKDDYPFLPLTAKQTPEVQTFCRSQRIHQEECFELDWNDATVERKLQAVARSIQQVHWRGPDILILQEVENRRILHMLNRHLVNSAYQTEVLLEGDDPRGIDVALLSRFPIIGSAQLHPIPGLRHTRGILEVHLELPNHRPLDVLGFHFPSQFHESAVRGLALEELIRLLQAQPPGQWTLAGGDSNMIRGDWLRLLRQRRELLSLGEQSFRLGCDLCPGTHFFRGEWHTLDWLFFSRTLENQVLKESILTPIWAEGQTNRLGQPIGFRPSCRKHQCKGVSDHLPIYGEILLYTQ